MLKVHLPSEGPAIGSLVALIASLSATSAFANAPRVHPGGLDQDLPARVAAIVASIDQTRPARLRDVLHAEMQVAQWRN
jgi:hypothetical protein